MLSATNFFSKTSKEVKIKELNDDIRRCNRYLDNHKAPKPQDDNHVFYYKKAESIVELGDLTKDYSHFDEALSCYTAAIDQVKDNVQYLIARSKRSLLSWFVVRLNSVT